MQCDKNRKRCQKESSIRMVDVGKGTKSVFLSEDARNLLIESYFATEYDFQNFFSEYLEMSMH